MDLRNFNYYDQDGNSIFNTINKASASGIIKLTSEYGSIGSVYSGINGIPVNGSSGIRFEGLKNYLIEFPDVVPRGSTALKYTLSYEDDVNTRNVTRELVYNWPGMQTVPQQLVLNDLRSGGGATNISLKFSDFDYLDDFGYTIFSGADLPPRSGIIKVYSAPFTNDENVGVLVGSLNYTYGDVGPFTLPTNFSVPYGEAQSLLIQFYDNTLGALRPASQVISVSFQAETMQIAIIKISNLSRKIIVSSLNYLNSDNKSLIYTFKGSTGGAGGTGGTGGTGTTESNKDISGATGYLQLFGPNGFVSQQLIQPDINYKYTFTY
jgi:hypothetical protein